MTGINDKHGCLCQKIAKRGLSSVALCSETAAGFGRERFNWFCRLGIGLTDRLGVKIAEHFNKSSLPRVPTSLAVRSGTHGIVSFCRTVWNDASLRKMRTFSTVRMEKCAGGRFRNLVLCLCVRAELLCLKDYTIRTCLPTSTLVPSPPPAAR